MRLSCFLLVPVVALSAYAQILPRNFNIEGCVSVGTVVGLLTGTTTKAAVGTHSTEESCASACGALTRDYGYYFRSPIKLGLGTADCICSNTPPAITQLVSATVAVNGALETGVCGALNGEVISVNSNFDLRACATAAVLANTVVGTPAKVTTVAQCVARCDGLSTAVYAVLNLSDGFCTCTSSTRIVNAAGLGVCAKGGAENAIYLNEARAIPSGGARKRQFTQKTLGLCPTGLQACLVGGDSASESDAYECLDIRAELESCGGCINGYADMTPGTASVGTDCSSLPGVALGASTCTLGKCEVSACKKGHNLVNGRCLRA